MNPTIEYKCCKCSKTFNNPIRRIKIAYSDNESTLTALASLVSKPATYDVCKSCLRDFEILVEDWEKKKKE